MRDLDGYSRFVAMYHETRDRVYAYAVTKAGRQLAEEVVSEVFLIAWRRRADVPDPPLPWLLSAARNVAANQLRSVAKDRSLAAELQAWIWDVARSEGDIAEQVTDRITILSALASLSEADRELLTLVAWHGLSSKAAARVTGCSAAAYFVRLHRARARLQRAVTVAEADDGSAVLAARPSQAVTSTPAVGRWSSRVWSTGVDRGSEERG